MYILARQPENTTIITVLAFGCFHHRLSVLWSRLLISYICTMKFGVVVFPGSNCDRDMYDALTPDLGHEVIMQWHNDKDVYEFIAEDCIILPGGFPFNDYLRFAAIASFSPTMH